MDLKLLCESEDQKFKGNKYLYSAQESKLTLEEVLKAFQEIDNLDLYYIGRKINNNKTSDIKAYLQFTKKIPLFNSALKIDGSIYKCTERKNLIDFIKKQDEFISNETQYQYKKLKVQDLKKKQNKKQEKQEQKKRHLQIDNQILLKLTLQECLSLKLINILDLFRIQNAYQEKIIQKQ